MKKKIAKIILGIFIGIFIIDILIFIFDCGLKLSELIPNPFRYITINNSREFKITEYLDLWFSFLGIFVTALLSYLLLKVSQKSNTISEQISTLEKNRDKQILNNNIATIYYQILYSIKQLYNLYIKYFINDKTQCCESIKLHNDWITVLSTIQSRLTIAEMDTIYQFFVDIENINHTSTNEKWKIINTTFRKYMLPCYFDTPKMFDLQKVDPITMLKPNILSILLFLFFALKQDAFTIDKKGNKYTISETDDNEYNGIVEICNNQFNGQVILSYNNVKINANFTNNILTSGNIQAFYDNTWYHFYDIQYQNINDFHAKFYNINSKSTYGDLIIDADYKNYTFKHGYIKFYKSKELWDGCVEYNGSSFNMIEGIIRNRLVEDTTRDYNYDAEEKYVEEMAEKQSDPKYCESIEEEEPIGYKTYEDFIYKDGKIVSRTNKVKEPKYSYLH